MCAIVDANSLADVFKDNPSERAAAFFNWLEEHHVKLVIGGTKYRHEVDEVKKASLWFRRAINTGRAEEVDDGTIDDDAHHLENLRDARSRKVLRSDDPHVLALARCSGARLLYTDDGDLIQDFTDGKIVGKPVGKALPPDEYHDFLNNRRNRRLCSRR